MGDARGQLELEDLNILIRTLAEVRPDAADVQRALKPLQLAGKEQTAALEDASDRWFAAVEVTLDHEGDYLARMLDAVRSGLPPRKLRKLEAAIAAAAHSCLQRVLRTDHPELDDKVDTLMAAQSFPDMAQAARAIRGVALDARRLLMDQLVGTQLVIGATMIDPEQQRMNLADLAVDVITASDYLLSVTGAPPATQMPAFSAEHDISGSEGRKAGRDADPGRTEDLRLRRALDARAAVVRLAGRLISALRRDTVAPI